MSFTSKVLLHVQEEVKVRWCQVRTVWRMVECIPKLNNCAGCMRKRSLLSRCPKYFLLFPCNNGCRNSPHCYVYTYLFSPINRICTHVLTYSQSLLKQVLGTKTNTHTSGLKNDKDLKTNTSYGESRFLWHSPRPVVTNSCLKRGHIT